MKSQPLRAALVGAGQMGRLHARVIDESELTELAAVVDPSPEAERLAWQRRTRWMRSLDDLLAGELPNLAVVAVPTAQHAAIAQALLAAGVPVLLEKPIAATVTEGETLIETARTNGVLWSVGHVEWFNPAVRELKARLDRHEIGRVFQVRAERLSPFPVRIGDGGVVQDLATHDIDVMCRLVGPPTRISAEIDRKAHRVHEDLLATVLRFASGAVGLIEVNWLTPTKVRRLTVTGEGGMFIVDYLNQHLTLYENAHEREAWRTLDIFDGVTEGNVTRFAIAREEPLHVQFESFVAAVRGQAPLAIRPEEALQTLRIALAAVEAGTRGCTLDLNLDAPDR